MSSSELNRDALFSLELVIDRLVLSDNVICRLPAVSFRLLDYPTLLIHLVEPKAVEELRADVLARYPSTTIPLQLPQLMNGNGEGFNFRHGKSCLLRISPSALRTQLSITPLFVSVIDVFPKVPKLVGSSCVPLEQCMDKLYGDIVSRGVSMPSVSAESCVVDVCNLNGDRLGAAFIRFRLLFLGSALLAHIPSEGLTSESKLKVEKEWVRNEPRLSAFGPSSGGTKLKIPIDGDGDEEILERPLCNDHSKEQEKLETVATQTSSRNHQNDRYSLEQTIAKSEHWEDIATSNMLCPPPLFYHSHKSSVRAYELPKQDWSVIWENANTAGIDSMSDDETIRFEDNSMEFCEETAPTVKSHQEAAYDSKYSKSDPTSGGATTDTAKFPLLNALLAEVLRLQGMNLVPMNNSPGDEVKKYTLRRRESITEKMSTAVEHTTPTATGVEHNSFRHRCVESTTSIPKDVSWIGRRSSVGNSPASSQLIAGMTNTQRLRLSKRNPRLLQELEIQEARRRSEFKAASKTRRKNSVKSEGKESMTGVSPELNERLQFTNEDPENDRLADSFDSKKSAGLCKVPVPTPRTSKSLLRDGEDENENTNLLVDKTHIPPSSHFDGSKTYSVVPKTTELSRSVQPSSSQGNTRFELDENQETKITKQSSVPEKILPASSNEHQSKAFGVTQVLSISSSSQELSNAKQAGSDKVVEMASVERLEVQKPIDSYSQNEANSNNEEVEEQLDCPSSLEDSGHQKDVEQQPADLVEIGLDGLKQIVDHYSDDSRENDGSEPDTSTGSQSARSYSSADSNESYSYSRSSSSQRSSDGDFSTSLRRIVATDNGAPIRPLGSQDVLGPASRKGDQRQLEIDVEQSASKSYSEIFEELSDSEDGDQVKGLRSASEAKPVREAKLGYTWGP